MQPENKIVKKNFETKKMNTKGRKICGRRLDEELKFIRFSSAQSFNYYERKWTKMRFWMDGCELEL